MPARESFEEGPMIEADAGTEVWAGIDADWRSRWRDGSPPTKGVHF